MVEYYQSEPMLDYEWHHDVLDEDFPSILQCLGNNGQKVFELERTPNGFKFVECCDSYYGVTLSALQMVHLIEELIDLLEASAKTSQS